MLAFEVWVNGKRHCLIGTEMSVAGIALSWVDRNPHDVQLNLGGLIRPGLHADWNAPKLRIGDEVTVRIIETDAADAPHKTYNPAEPKGKRKKTTRKPTQVKSDKRKRTER